MKNVSSEIIRFDMLVLLSLSKMEKEMGLLKKQYGSL